MLGNLKAGVNHIFRNIEISGAKYIAGPVYQSRFFERAPENLISRLIGKFYIFWGL